MAEPINPQAALANIKSQAEEIQTNIGEMALREQAAAADPLAGLQKKLLDSADIITSEDTGVDTAISGVINELKASRERSVAGTKAAFELRRRDEGRDFERKLTSERESQRGMATNVAAMRQMEEDHKRTMRDLEIAEQAALLSGDAESAEKIAGLKIQQIQFNVESKQKAFSNLLSLGQFSMQQKSEARQERESNFSIMKSKLDLALEGVAQGSGLGWNSLDAGTRKDLTETANKLGLGTASLKKIVDAKANNPDVQVVESGGGVFLYDKGKGTFSTLMARPPKEVSQEALKQLKRKEVTDLIEQARSRNGDGMLGYEDQYKVIKRAYVDASLGTGPDFDNEYASTLLSEESLGKLRKDRDFLPKSPTLLEQFQQQQQYLKSGR